MNEYTSLNFGLGNNSDPIHSMFVKRKQQSDVLPEIIPHNEKDVAELHEFCKSHGIVGVNFGNMSPKAALAMLKSRFGESSLTTIRSEKSLLKG